MLSLSTHWNSHRHDEDGMHMVYEAILLGFNNIAFDQSLSPALMPGFEKAFKQNVRVKNPFINFSNLYNYGSSIDATAESECYSFTSPEKELRRQAIDSSKKSIDRAADFGGIDLVMRLGHAAMKNYSDELIELLSSGELYSKSYAALKLEMVQAREQLDSTQLDAVRAALDELLPYAQEKGVRLALESGSRYEQIPNEREMDTLLCEYDSPGLVYWHDLGHIQLKANMGLLNHQQYLEKMLPRLAGCNLHDVVWPVEDRSIPFQGTIDFDQLIPLVPKNIPMVWMMNPRRKSNDIKEALVTWKEKYGD